MLIPTFNLFHFFNHLFEQCVSSMIVLAKLVFFCYFPESDKRVGIYPAINEKNFKIDQ